MTTRLRFIAWSTKGIFAPNTAKSKQSYYHQTSLYHPVSHKDFFCSPARSTKGNFAQNTDKRRKRKTFTSSGTKKVYIFSRLAVYLRMSKMESSVETRQYFKFLELFCAKFTLIPLVPHVTVWSL